MVETTHALTDNTAPVAPASSGEEHHSWLSDAASSAWGAARVVGAGLAGAAKEVVDHPLRTAGEVVVGVGVAAVAAEAGVGLAAGAAIGATALAGYGLVRGVEIATTEGVGAIPEHMREGLASARETAGNIADAASTLYHGTADQAHMQAAEQVIENTGRATVPFAAGAIGGAGGELGQMTIRGGGELLSGLLPGLSLEPAYAGAGGVLDGTISSAVTRAASAGEAGMASAATGTVMHRDGAAGGEGSGPGGSSGEGRLSEYDQNQHFIEGKPRGVPVEAPKGPASTVAEGFRDIDNVLKNGGRHGVFEFQDDGGFYTATATEGPLKGRTAIWEKGQPSFSMDGTGGRSFDFLVGK